MALDPSAGTYATTPNDEQHSKTLGSTSDVQESESGLEMAKGDKEVDTTSVKQPKEDSDNTIKSTGSLLRQEAQEPGGMLNLLYKACNEGKLEVFEFLLSAMPPNSNIDLSAAKFSDGGLTPLHVASKNGHREMVTFLLDKGASPMVVDEARNTPLHLAATYGHLEVAMDLLVHESQNNEAACESVRSNLLQMTNSHGLSPFGCALKASEPHFHIAKEFLNVIHGNPANAIPDFSKSQFFSKHDMVPLEKPAKIFIVGDADAGKSTLVKSLQEGKSAFPRRLIGLIVSRLVTNIDEHFSGIIITDFANANLGRVLFHDLAGHTNYFNESLMEPNDHLEHCVFVVVVDLRFNPQKTEERLIYWLNFLHYHTSKLANEGLKPNIVVVGSHKDMKRGVWRSGEKFNEVYTEALKRRPQLSNYFNQLMKPVSLDCRRFDFSEARQVRSCLQKHCQNSIYTQLEATPLPSVCYILSQVLFDKEIPPFLKLSDLAHKISDLAAKPDLSLYKLLPTEPTKLMEICKMLHKHDRLIIVHNPVSSSDLYHWIVHDMHALLTEIDKRLATLKISLSASGEDIEMIDNMAEQETGHSVPHFGHFGIVTREKLDSVFSGSRKPSRKGSASSGLKVSESSTTPLSTASSTSGINLNLAVELLLKYKYCEVISSNDPAFFSESFFFPGLLQEVVGEPDPWEPGANYSFAWCVVPCPQDNNVIEFFLPRFLKKLLLCFIEKFLIRHPEKQGQQEQDDISSMSSSNDTTVVWSRGVSWLTIDDTKVHIELNDNAIILSMYSQEGKELNCLQLRNKILATIKDEKKKWQPDIATSESIIPFGDKFPVQLKNFDTHRRIPLKSIENAILKRKSKVDDVELQMLLFYEPCIAVSRLKKTLRDVICDPDQVTELSQENLSELVDELGKEFLQHFNLADHQSESTSQPHTSSTQSVTTDGEEEAPATTILQNPDSQIISSITHTSPPAIPSAMAHDASEWNITPKKLVECMNSISIIDIVEFLQQLKKQPPSPPPSETSSLERDDIQLDSEGGKDSTLKRSQQHSIFTLSDSDLPFIETPTVLQCSSEQQVYNFKKYGIKLAFPPGAVTRGTLDVEMGILHSGPFTLPPNLKPISPVIWLCAKENQSHEFSKRIEITLPHFMDCTPEDQKKFAFLKAAHNHSIPDNSFNFKEANSDHCRFQPRNGTLTTKQCCLLCIAYKDPEGMIDKSNYCLVSFIPRDIAQSTFAMYFCMIFNLKTFIEVLQTQLPGCEIYAKKEFKFANGSTGKQQRAITIHFSTHFPHGWIVANSGFESKIAASEVDFYDSNAFGYLRYLEEDDDYPPRFTIEVNGSSATKTDILCVSFKGATKELKIEKSLTVLHNQLSGSVSLDVFTDDPQDLIKQQSPSGSLVRHTSTPSLSAAANILERNLDILLKYLDVNVIRPALRKNGVLLPDEADKLLDFSNHSGATRGNVIEKLVTMLSSKGSSGIYNFKKALEETTEAMGHQDILKELSKDPDFEKIVNDPSYAGN